MNREIARHKTAINRVDLSRPMKGAIEDGILTLDKAVFDYGCGRGGDIARLTTLGYDCAGWDPKHRPNTPIQPAPIVNLGYVINVIENPAERSDTLKKAYHLSQDVLIVSARLNSETRELRCSQEHSDGYLTGAGTFQKFFDQAELKNWIDQTLGVSAIPAGPGVFYVFRSEQARTTFLASRYRSRVSLPRTTSAEVLYSRYQEILQPLIDFFQFRGRIPIEEELSEHAGPIVDRFGSIKRAYRVLTTATDASEWQSISEKRATELLIFLALGRFEGRPSFSSLPQPIRLDIKQFFSTYSAACLRADSLLFSLGDSKVRQEALDASHIGKRLPFALYVHESALNSLSAELRLLEGCARAFIGRVDGANIIKIHREDPKITYLSYPSFETDPHPSLATSLSIHLQTFKIKARNFAESRNPPILHRKETFLAPEHPLYAKFARLTRIEEEKGLYEDTSVIGTREGWDTVLCREGYFLRGHRLLTRATKSN